MNQIIKADAIEFLKGLKNKPKLILTDPPYGMNYHTNIPGDKRWNKDGNTKGRFDVLENDQSLDEIDFDKFFEACYDCLDEDGFLFIFCNDKALVEWAPKAQKAKFIWKDTLYWDKFSANGGDIKWRFTSVVEMILCFVKGSPSTYKMYCQRKINEPKPTKKYDEYRPLKKRILNIFRTGRVSKVEQCGHPTQKPLEICEQLIRGTTRKGACVVDPFCGSGSVLAAAKSMKREFDGCDIDTKYVELAINRVENTPLKKKSKIVE